MPIKPILWGKDLPKVFYGEKTYHRFSKVFYDEKKRKEGLLWGEYLSQTIYGEKTYIDTKPITGLWSEELSPIYYYRFITIADLSQVI